MANVRCKGRPVTLSQLADHYGQRELASSNRWKTHSTKMGYRGYLRKKIPAVLEIKEVQVLLGALDVRERTMVLLDVVTGLRASELFGLKWTDINFKKNEISVTRSIVMQVVGPCKTEASQKPVPLDPVLARTLRSWQAHAKYKALSDWVFASPHSGGRKPYWYQSLKRNRIREAARGVGIAKKIGWHTFRHTCATLLRASGSGHQSCPGVAPACVLPCHSAHLHAGRH